MHPLIENYRKDKNVSFEAFCDAALNFSDDLMFEISRNIPDGTAANYISKIRALRAFVVQRNLALSSPEELAQLLAKSCGISAVRDISRRKLRGYYAETRDAKSSAQMNFIVLTSYLERLGRQDLEAIRSLIDRLIAQK